MREVQGERFFHINRVLAYAPRPLLGIGETVEVGEEESPFFRFYRTHTRQEPVKQPDGLVDLVPSIAFLRQVRDGKVRACNLPGVAFDTARHFMMLARELLCEQIRVSEFSENPSRQRAMWLFADADKAPHWEIQPMKRGWPGHA